MNCDSINVFNNRNFRIEQGIGSVFVERHHINLAIEMLCQILGLFGNALWWATIKPRRLVVRGNVEDLFQEVMDVMDWLLGICYRPYSVASVKLKSHINIYAIIALNNCLHTSFSPR